MCSLQHWAPLLLVLPTLVIGLVIPPAPPPSLHVNTEDKLDQPNERVNGQATRKDARIGHEPMKGACVCRHEGLRTKDPGVLRGWLPSQPTGRQHSAPAGLRHTGTRTRDQ